MQWRILQVGVARLRAAAFAQRRATVAVDPMGHDHSAGGDPKVLVVDHTCAGEDKSPVWRAPTVGRGAVSLSSDDIVRAVVEAVPDDRNMD